ncbi:MAG: T9SS type A sorting domain-containing protein [Bacteroides sp.]|nr:T9SS type A sorting domain-containing protein [Ruminococcus flavefaciens]MCM1554618.1 T9SS type A sorting domain-containing protein [Bacteroides sp.]
MKKMKFLIGALSFLAAAFMVSPSQAQIKTYLEEDFQQGLTKTLWNINECTNISETEGPLHFLQTSQTDIWAGWVRDPNGQVIQGGGFNDTINGTYEIIAFPFKMEEDVFNIVSLDYMWNVTSINTTRNFGVRVRLENDEVWDTVEILNLNKTYLEGKFVAVLDSKWNGKKVEMELFFSTTHNASAFYFLMDNVKFAAYAKTPEVSTSLKAAPVAWDELPLNLTIANIGALDVNSIEYTFDIDNGKQTGTLPITLGSGDDALEPISGIVTGSISIELKGLDFGKHTLKMQATKINGETNANPTATEIEFFTLDESKLNQPYVPLFEGFTSSTCSPCASANRYLNPVLTELRDAGALNVIKYQMYFPGTGDPYYIEGNKTRMEFYDEVFGLGGYWGVPFPVYNGMEVVTQWEGQYWTDLQRQLKEKATAAHAHKASFDIDITEASIDDSKKLSLKFEVTPNISITGRVFAVVVEKTTTGNKCTNGETEFHNVAMAFLPTAGGVSKNFETGKTETFTSSTNMGRTHMEESHDLQIICFVQHESGYIFQSSSIVKGGNVANENEVMGDVRVYPNPAFENVNITNLDGADVEIFDLTGRRVYFSNHVNGDLQIATSAFAQGTYVVRLTKDGKSAHRKLVVVK